MKKIELDEDKMFYSIGEVAKIFDVNTSLIRFWEKEFKQIAPKKTSNGKRKFTHKDIHNIHSVYKLVKEKGFTLIGAKEHLKSNSKQDSRIAEIELKLNNIKFTLAQLIER